jgi:DNA-binding NtrC family response regulator
MTSVLFVDDEVALLRAMRLGLGRARREWRFVFVPSATEALEMMLHEPFDAIVSDLRMPGMDGASLLAVVRERYHQTVRIVLTGAADEETMTRAECSAHEILHKPCLASQVLECIDRLRVRS